MSPAQEQFRRVIHYLRRMERMGATDEDTEDMYTFFMHAWHLCDWVSNDPTLNQKRSLEVIRKSDCTDSIRLCGDIADGRKHYTLTRPPRQYGEVTLKDIRITPGAGIPAQARYQFTFPDGSKRDALDFAREIVRDWEGILSRYGVSLGTS